MFFTKAIKFTTLILILFFLAFPCFSQSLDAEISTHIIQDTIDTGKKQYFLNCNTIAEYNNGSTVIKFKKKKKGQNFKIIFTGVKTPNKVAKSIGPAHVRIPLGHLEEGEYSFQFITMSGQKEYTWEGKLRIYGSRFVWNTIKTNQ